MIAEKVPQLEHEIPQICRDPKDDYLLAYAIAGKADYIVTGDKDLLVLEEIEGVKIVKVHDFVTECLQD
ncbi:MAG: putative toxin-antitoxin system toxin component, PIN family, partial [Chloroflexota bacterium]